VSNGDTNTLSNYDCSLRDNGMCLLISKMLSKFFDDENAAVTGIGWVDLDLRTERHRDRMLQNGNTKISTIESRNKFSLSMKVIDPIRAANSVKTNSDISDSSSSKSFRHSIYPHSNPISCLLFPLLIFLC